MIKKLKKAIAVILVIIFIFSIYFFFYKGYAFALMPLDMISKISTLEFRSEFRLFERARSNRIKVLLERMNHDFYYADNWYYYNKEYQSNLIMDYANLRDDLLNTDDMQNFILAGAITYSIDSIITSALNGSRDECSPSDYPEILSTNNNISDYQIIKKFESIIQIDKTTQISIDDITGRDINNNRKYFSQFSLKYDSIENWQLLISADDDRLDFEKKCIAENPTLDFHNPGPCFIFDELLLPGYLKRPNAFKIINSHKQSETLLFWCHVLDHRKQVKTLNDLLEDKGCLLNFKSSEQDLFKEYIIKHGNKSSRWYIQNTNNLDNQVNILHLPLVENEKSIREKGVLHTPSGSNSYILYSPDISGGDITIILHSLKLLLIDGIWDLGG